MTSSLQRRVPGRTPDEPSRGARREDRSQAALGARAVAARGTADQAIGGMLPCPAPDADPAAGAMRPAPLVRIVLQREPWDCGVAALATATGVDYEAALAACSGVLRRRPGRGLTAPALLRAARHLARPMRQRVPGTFGLRQSAGVLGLDYPDGSGHWAFTLGGTLYNTDGAVWDLAEYLVAHQARAAELLVRV